MKSCTLFIWTRVVSIHYKKYKKFFSTGIWNRFCIHFSNLNIKVTPFFSPPLVCLHAKKFVSLKMRNRFRMLDFILFIVAPKTCHFATNRKESRNQLFEDFIPSRFVRIYNLTRIFSNLRSSFFSCCYLFSCVWTTGRQKEDCIDQKTMNGKHNMKGRTKKPLIGSQEWRHSEEGPFK